MTYRVLKLNADYQPMEIITWRKAIELWWDDKVEIVTDYEDFQLKSVSITMNCPAVVRMLQYCGWRRKVKCTRNNIMRRDKWTCQYCGIKPGTADLNLDHVVPRSRGGKTTWDNVVTSCIKCNSRKADKTPSEANMKLNSEPRRPSGHDWMKLLVAVPKTPDAWRDYLYWNQELEQ